MYGKIFLFLSLITIAVSCKKTTGNWSDNIKLSQKTATLNYSKDSILITTGEKGWWVNEVVLDSSNIDISSIKSTIPPTRFVLTNPDFTLTLYNGDSLKIVMFENPLKISRKLSIVLENGDYFDYIQITQTANLH